METGRKDEGLQTWGVLCSKPCRDRPRNGFGGIAKPPVPDRG